MRLAIASLAILVVGSVGCNQTSRAEQTTSKATSKTPEPPNTHPNAPNADGWWIESYKDPIIRVRHDGKVYEAKCEHSESFIKLSQATTDKPGEYPRCEQPFSLVGKDIQGFAGTLKDDKGWTAKMWSVDSRLMIQQTDGQSWFVDHFLIVSVVAQTQ